MKRETVYTGANPYLFECVFGKRSQNKGCECEKIKGLIDDLRERVEKLEKVIQRTLEVESKLWQGKREEVEQL